MQIPPLDLGDGREAPPSPSAPPTPAAPALPPPTETNPLWIASVATGITGFAVGVPAGYVWGMMALTNDACTPLGGTFFCASDGVRNTWLAVSAVSLTVGVIGTIGIVAFPRKLQVAPSATSNGAGAVLIGQF